MKPVETTTFQPRLKVLDREQGLAIHTAALEILEKTGFKMEHPQVLELLVIVLLRAGNQDLLDALVPGGELQLHPQTRLRVAVLECRLELRREFAGGGIEQMRPREQRLDLL